MSKPARSLTERHRADPVKSGGVHYTPAPLASFVAEQAIAASHLGDAVRVLDPACGDGALLAAVARALPRAVDAELFGYDRDGTAVQQAYARLAGVRDHCSVSLGEVDFIDAVLEERSIGPFDLVIANPPYVRTQVLGREQARRLASGFGLTGRIDLYQAFAVAMATTLAHGGVMALLCSNRFLTTRSGTALRGVLRDRFEIVSIFDLGDTKVFDASVLPAVVIARRRDSVSGRFAMASIYADRAGGAPTRAAVSVADAVTGAAGAVSIDGAVYDVRRGCVDPADPSKPWTPIPRDGWIARVEGAATMRFGDVGKVRVGVKTTADDVFIRARWDDQPHVPEPALLHPLLTHQVTRRWQVNPAVMTILYPYDRSVARRTPVDLAQWPATASYLGLHHDRLARRTYVVDGGRHWWEIWVPQRPSAWTRPKIVFPDISEEPKFAYDTTGAIVNGDCYWLTVDDERLALVMMAIANSLLGVAYYDAVCANRLYAGRRRYITQYVERFPIPDLREPVVEQIVDTVRRLMSAPTAVGVPALEAEIDRLVRVSFGLEAERSRL